MTAAEDAKPGCEATGGALMPIGEQLEALFVGSVACRELHAPVSIEFHELMGAFITGAVLLPMSFVV
jgi:hypothetical protein